MDAVEFEQSVFAREFERTKLRKGKSEEKVISEFGCHKIANV
jgi:hypothetical protein